MSTAFITASTDPRILDPLLKEQTYAGMNSDPELLMYKELANIKSMADSPIPDGVRKHSMFGLGAMQERRDTSPFAFDAPGSVGTKERKVRFFGLAAIFSEFLLRKDMYGVIPNVLKDLGMSHELRRAMEVAEFYDDAFVGDNYKTYQNQVFMQSTAGDGHITAGAPTVRRYNALNPSAPVSYTALQSAIIMRKQMRNDRGLQQAAPLQGLRLVEPAEAMFESDRLLDPNSRLEPTSDKNAVNVLQKYAISTYINTYIATTNWFLLDPKSSRMGGNPVEIYDDMELTADTDKDIETKGVRHDVRASYLVMEGHWETMTGSNG